MEIRASISIAVIACRPITTYRQHRRRRTLEWCPLTTYRSINARAKQTKMSLSARTWSRPKTPVYGLLTFANETGYEKAIDASLRIFVMIIQRHMLLVVAHEYLVYSRYTGGTSMY